MQNEIIILLSCVAGFVCGIGFTYIFYHKLQQRLNAETLEGVNLLSKLETEGKRVAQLEEQTTQIPKLEQALQKTENEIANVNEQLADLRQQHGAAMSTITARDEQIARNQEIIADLNVLRDNFEKQIQGFKQENATLSAELEAEREHSKEKLALLEEAKEQLSLKFKDLANNILENKSKRFTEQNQTSLKQILDPLKTQLTEFKDQVEKSYHQEGKDRSALAAQVQNLMELNKQLSDDAHNLTSALKGQSKTRGDWGELVLERVLEASGLRKGHEYVTQESHTREDGTRAQPDVVIYLPDNKNIVVDSKLSLISYLKCTEATSEEQSKAAIKLHLDSVKTHIKDLSSKNYQALYDLESLDFVIMFVPIEPAFMLAIAHDATLWQEAWDKNILLVSPTTLLFAVRIVAQVWRQEYQSRNAQDIAQRGGLLYDKFKGFVSELENVGKRIRQAGESYEKTFNKLSIGTGNLVRQAEMLKELGVKPKKSLDNRLIEAALDNDSGFKKKEDNSA